MKMMPKLATIAALLLAACAPMTLPGPGKPADAKPGLWLAYDDDTRIYMFGTIHVLPDGFTWDTATIRDALAHSDTLVLETLLDADPQKTAAMMLKMGRSPGLPPLVDRIAPAKKAALQAMITRSKLPVKFLDGLETWAATLMLVGVQLRDLQLTAGSGVEEQLKAQFKIADKPLDQLEAPETQLGYLDTLPEAAQREFLASVVDEPQQNRQDFDKMLAAWRRGDERAISKTFDDEIGLSPVLAEALLRRRNALWTDELVARLAKPGTIFVAVGAGHLAGPGSLQRLLKAKGVKVKRVQ